MYGIKNEPAPKWALPLLEHFSVHTTQSELEQVIQALNQDERVDGILVQLPLPDHLDAVSLHQIDPDKDADGLQLT